MEHQCFGFNSQAHKTSNGGPSGHEYKNHGYFELNPVNTKYSIWCDVHL